MELKTAIEHALAGHAVLFTGAGFSRQALNLKKQQIKSGRELSGYLATEVGLPESVALDEAAEEFASQLGTDRLIAVLQEEFTASSVGVAHRRIARVPWKRIYTTNYDNVLETAYVAEGRKLQPITLSKDIRDISKETPLCVHINGYIGELTRETVWSEVKLTDSSYLTASIADSPWLALFRTDLETAKAIFFVGYSLADLDLRRILFEHDSLRKKCFFAVGAAPEPATVLRARRFGTVLEVDTDTLANQVGAIAKTYVASSDTAPLEYCVRQHKLSSPKVPLADRYILDLLSFGQVRTEHVWKSLRGGDRYVLHRAAADQALESIRNGVRAVAIYSDLGNGKSLLLETLKCTAADKGYTVYSLIHQGETLLEELEHAFAGPRPAIFLIDNYPGWLDAMKFFGTHSTDEIAIVVTARTSAHDTLIDRLADAVRVGVITEIGVDKLTTDEVDWIISFLDEYGLWGAKAAWSKARKREHLNQTCRAEWHAILLNLIDSPQILSRFEAIFSDVQKQRNYHEVTLAILVLAVLNYTPSLNMLIDLCGQRVLETGFRRDPAAREIIDFASGRIRLRSSVAGEFILRKIADPNAVVQILITLTKAADRASSASREYFNIFKTLTRYSSLRTILPESDRGRSTMRFYEMVKGLGNCRRNPLFWLQYAIACVASEEFERAEKYFQTAYSFASERDLFDTYQIDNHYARHVLMRALRSGDVPQAMTAFRTARAIIFKQMEEKERLHYPYRVAVILGELYDNFASELERAQQEEIARTAKFICERIEKLPAQRQEQRNIVSCWVAMRGIIERQHVT